jgi:phytoene dehydrogenase-like protein
MNANANPPADTVDVLIIGAGIGGLIAACELAQAGKKVLVVENLSFIGGRFSAFQVNGSEIPSGAFHTFPHGERGPIAQALQRSGAKVEVPATKIYASFHVRGQHILAKTGFGAFKAVDNTADRLLMWRVLLQSWFQRDYPGSFGDWLISLGASEAVRLMYDRFAHFALSASIYDLPYAEGRAVIEMIINYGLPGVPVGGAREVARQLGLAATQAGVQIRKNTQVRDLLTCDGQLCGATVYDRRKEQSYTIQADQVISSMGPGATLKLAEQAGLVAETEQITQIQPPAPAIGLKIQVMSPRSLIDHDSIMFCLDTQRVAGVLQATNVDPDLAPPGCHLLISHQVIPRGADWQAERDLGLQDWRYLFGSAFDDCEVVGTSHFPDRFPVNWASQGLDLRTQPFAAQGLWMVGDGLKPPGMMMVEGVAASAERTVAQMLGRADLSPWRLSARDQVVNWTRRLRKWTFGR